jgi:hypothetical protein
MIYKKVLEGRMRRQRRVIAVAACTLGFVGAWAIASAGAAPGVPAHPTTARAASQASPASGKPALWRTYDIIVDLQNLPRTYTCNQLWYEFHGILERLGAWPYSINILPYNCSPTPSGDMKSPDVQVRFQLPIFLQGPAVKWAPAEAIERTVRLSPGEPKTLQTSDCQLLQQIGQTLLTSIQARVEEEHFDCSAPAQRSAKFNVTLSLPMAVKMPTVATTSAPAPH